MTGTTGTPPRPDDAPAAGAADFARVLRLLGLGVRARNAVVGVERVREAAGRGTLVLAVIAPDASHHSLDKVVPLLRARRIPVLDGPGAAELGRAVGREATAVVGVTDRALARGIGASYGQGLPELDEHAGQRDGARGVRRAGSAPGRAKRARPPRRDPRRMD